MAVVDVVCYVYDLLICTHTDNENIKSLTRYIHTYIQCCRYAYYDYSLLPKLLS